MGQIVVNGASLVCPMGKPGTASLVVLPTPMVNSADQPVATIMDNKPTANIPTFGMCTRRPTRRWRRRHLPLSASSRRSRACPVIAAPWAPGSATVMVGNKPALTSDSSCMCQWGGKISITNAGQTKTTTG